VELSDEMLTYDDAIPGPSNMPPPPPPASTSITASDFSSSASEPRPVTTQRGKRSTKRKTLHSKKGKAKGRKIQYLFHFSFSALTSLHCITDIKEVNLYL
jgi:hypothetical protein